MNINRLSIMIFLIAVSKVYAADVMEIEFRLSEIRATKRAQVQEPTGYSPKKKKPRSHDVTSAALAMIRNIWVNGEKSKIIHFNDSAFYEDYWSCVDPACSDATVSFNANDETWDGIADLFFEEGCHFTDEMHFLYTLLLFCYDTIDDYYHLLIYDARDSIVCRHVATYALPLCAKILRDNRTFFQGTIKQLSGEMVNHAWKSVDEGHVWNIISLRDNKGTESHWFFDTHHQKFVYLAPEKKLEDLMLIKFNENRTPYTVPLSEDPEVLDFVRLTMEKLNIGPGEKPVLYRDPQAEKHASQKFHANYSLPKTARKQLFF